MGATGKNWKPEDKACLHQGNGKGLTKESQQGDWKAERGAIRVDLGQRLDEKPPEVDVQC